MILEGTLSKVKMDRQTRIVTAQVRCKPEDRQFYVFTAAAGPTNPFVNGRRIRFINSRVAPGVALLVEIIEEKQ
jgi:hypothetical protein